MVRKRGEIVFDGRSIAGHSPHAVARRGIAHVPEGRGLFAELTVWENLRMGAYVRGERRALKQEADRSSVTSRGWRSAATSRPGR